LSRVRSSKKSRSQLPARPRGPQTTAPSRKPPADEPRKASAGFDPRTLLAVLMVAAGIIAYFNSFEGKLVFDDEKHITDNAQIVSVFPLSETLKGRRPMVDLSLAINRHFDLMDGKLDLRGFHAFNLCIHLLAGLMLFGIIRRTILRGRFSEPVQAAAPWFALAVGVIWIVHPLQTQSVTYLIQRGESMAGLCYLLVLYFVLRGEGSKFAPAWYIGAVIACAVGAGCKATIVTAPFVVLIYDRVFLSKSFTELFRRRWALYAGLVAACFVLALCGVLRGILRTNATGATVGFSVVDVSSWEYLISQPGVIAYYVRLTLWPHPLCLDYNWPIAKTPVDVLGPGLVMIPLIAGTIWGFVRKPWVGFVGAWFFIILAPTSSFIPIKDLLFEHRMYLSLAAVIVILVALVYRGLLYLCEHRLLDKGGRQAFAVVLVLAAVVPLTYGTIRRNEDYHDALGMWHDVIVKSPENHRAYLGYGTAIFALGEKAKAARDMVTAGQHFAAAESAFQTAVGLKATYGDAWYNLGNALNENGKRIEAIDAYRKSMRHKAKNAKAYYNLANVFKNLAREEKDPSRYEEAVTEYETAIRIDPKHIRAHVNLGNTLKVLGRYDEAIAMYKRALKINYQHANTHHNLGDAYFLQERYTEAKGEFELAIEYNPNHSHAKRGLETTLARLREDGG